MWLSALAILAKKSSPWSLADVALYPVFLLISIALHEAGHALVAKVLGLRVPRIEVGFGRRLRRWRWGKTTIALNVLPFIGLTYLGSDELRGLRAKLWFAILAGPLVTFALLAGARSWPTPIPFSHLAFPIDSVVGLSAPREVFCFINFWLLFFSVLPLPLRGTGGFRASDGWQLVSLPFRSSRRLREFLAVPAILETQDRIEKGDHDGAQRVIEDALRLAPDSWSLRNSLAAVQLARGQFGEARAAFLALLEADPPSEMYRWIARNNLAWTNYLLGADELRAEADELSAAVYAHMPKLAFAMGTRGSVLTWLGRHNDAVPLLRRAYELHSVPNARASVACALATACVRIGRLAAAEKWIERAIANDPSCRLIERAKAALVSASPEPMPSSSPSSGAGRTG